MAADWNLAALIVAIVALAFTPAPQRLIARLVEFLHARIWPVSAVCETLEWNDIQDGQPLHICNTRPLNCDHHWKPTFANLFTAKNPSRTVKKPASLDLSTTYLRTDTKTLKAFMILLNRKDTRIQLEQSHNVLTAYIRTGPPDWSPGHNANIAQVTKDDIEKIIDGYPPWYRDPLPLVSGATIPHPIRDIGDVSRASPREELEITALTRALKRVLHCLRNLEKVYGDPKLKMAWDPVKQSIDFVNKQSSSSSFIRAFEISPLAHEFGNDWFKNPRRPFAKDVTKDQAILVTQLFNQYDELSERQVRDFESIWVIALRAALTGTWNVAWEVYLRYSRSDRSIYGGDRYELPAELKEHRHVYLFENPES